MKTRRTSLNASAMIVNCPGVSRISTGYEATAIMRGIPYGAQATEALAGGSPRFVASASAARCARYSLAYAGLSTTGPAGGGATAGSAPRPAPNGAHTPVMPGRAWLCPAAGDATAIAHSTTPTTQTRIRERVVIDLLSARRCARCGRGWGSAGSDAHRSAIAKYAAVGERDAIQEAPGFAAAKRA